MPIARPHTVLFDLDGTLVDTIPLIVASYQHALASVLGRGEDERVIRSWIGRTLRERFAELAPDRAEELYEAYTSWNLAHTSELLRPIDGVPELLKALGVAGIATGVVTSKRRATALLALDGASLSDLIPVLATMLDTVRHKPLPDPLLHGLSVLGALAEGAIYVGDAVVDVQAARAAGMGSIAVLWGAGEAEALVAAKPDAVCRSVPELWALLG